MQSDNKEGPFGRTITFTDAEAFNSPPGFFKYESNGMQRW